MPFALEPHVAGQLGAGTALDATVHPPVVRSVEYVLDAPTSQDILESFPVYLVSNDIAAQLARASLRGFVLRDARITVSREYLDEFGNAQHKDYQWLYPTPDLAADCWIDDQLRLCVSGAMMDVLATGTLDACTIIEIP